MSIAIIEEEVKSYLLTYEDDQGDGYAFPCNEEGHILWDDVYSPETTRMSLAYCKAHQDRWTGRCGEVVTVVYRIRYGICPACGRRVYFGGSGWASSSRVECDCGKWYNLFGEEIIPPKYWEEAPLEDYWEV